LPSIEIIGKFRPGLLEAKRAKRNEYPGQIEHFRMGR
jgi:hypothetical protein